MCKNASHDVTLLLDAYLAFGVLSVARVLWVSLLQSGMATS